MGSDEFLAVGVVDDVDGIERARKAYPGEHGCDGCHHFLLRNLGVLAADGMGAQTIVASAHSSEHTEGDEFAVLEVDAVAGVELAKAVVGHEADDVLLSFGRCLEHIFGIAFAPERVDHLDALLPAVSVGGGGLVVEGQTDVIVLEHFVHDEQEVDDAREAEERNGLIDNLTDFAGLDTDVEGGIDMDAEFGDGVASERRGQDAHDARFLDDRAVGNFEGLVEGEVVEDGCEFRVALERIDVVADRKEFLDDSVRLFSDFDFFHGKVCFLI